ncbi:hypothetical protein ACH4YO_19945 [Streptomyces noursei]|uniref:hypothetical protein n=1 Tax=Streptomyces noursei TaxID=1971 RepID=UPI00340DB7D2
MTRRPCTNRDGDAAVETLDLTVDGDRSVAGLRRLATRQATAAVAQLRQGQG